MLRRVATSAARGRWTHRARAGSWPWAFSQPALGWYCIGPRSPQLRSSTMTTAWTFLRRSSGITALMSASLFSRNRRARRPSSSFGFSSSRSSTRTVQPSTSRGVRETGLLTGGAISRAARGRRIFTVSDLQQAGAVAEAGRPHLQAVQQGEVKVRHRHVLAVVDVLAGLQRAVALAEHEDGQPLVDVLVAVGDAGPVD